MPRKNLYDVLVIGSGATGIWAATELGAASLSVVLVESGGLPTPEEQLPIKLQNANVIDTEECLPYSFPKGRPFNWRRTEVLGGRTFVWGKVCPRMSDFDFRPRDRYASISTWPFSYAELAPYYDKVERAMRVAGHRDHLVQVPDGKFVSYRPSRVHAHFRDRVENRSKEYRVVPARYATRNIASLLEKFFVMRKASIRTGLTATQLLLSKDGHRVTGAILANRETRKSEEIFAKTVVLCGSSIYSTHLMMTSKSRHHPDGVGNSAGVLGRYLMDHTRVEAGGIIPARHGYRRGRNDYHGMSYVPRFLGEPFETASANRGFGVQVHWYPCDEDPRTCIFHASSPPPHVGHFEMISFGEVLPDRRNRMTLNSRKLDAFGRPTPFIEFRYRGHELKILRHQKQTLKDLANAAGLEILHGPLVSPPGAHEVGTARMGSHPDFSVLNPFNQVWEVPNLHVMDGASFVSSGCQNSTLTMMAVCGRACDYLIRAFRNGLF